MNFSDNKGVIRGLGDTHGNQTAAPELGKSLFQATARSQTETDSKLNTMLF